MGTSSRRWLTTWASDSAGSTVTPSTSAASALSTAGTKTWVNPSSLARATIGRMPAVWRRLPSSESSPRNTVFDRLADTCPVLTRMPMAMGRSYAGPSFLRSAGARLAVMRRIGNSQPELRMAARTRSRASWTALSGRPTT